METTQVNRRIPFSSMRNFRDVGGYPTPDGRTVRWGRLYRSDSLHRIEGADRYADLAGTGAAGLAEAVGLIADSTNAPVVVHCVTGKDRTGIVCALTLAALGVNDADIAADYALSTEASERFSAWVAATTPPGGEPPAPFLASPAEAMTLFLTGLRQGYGSVEGYLRHAGVSDTQLAALRAHLLG